jgi:hypothetical protein
VLFITEAVQFVAIHDTEFRTPLFKPFDTEKRNHLEFMLR